MVMKADILFRKISDEIRDVLVFWGGCRMCCFLAYPGPEGLGVCGGGAEEQ